jgi:hypothetical protein
MNYPSRAPKLITTYMVTLSLLLWLVAALSLACMR